MQAKKSKKVFTITLEFDNGVTRPVKVRATTREIAERKALKFNPTAKGVKYDGV